MNVEEKEKFLMMKIPQGNCKFITNLYLFFDWNRKKNEEKKIELLDSFIYSLFEKNK